MVAVVEPLTISANSVTYTLPASSVSRHRTAYLWERVWTKDSWMDLLARFIHVDRPEKGSPAA